MKKFTTGQKLSARSICDYDCIFRGTVVKRTAKFITLKIDGYRDLKRVKVNVHEDVEEVYPLGRYSMAPCFTAA